MHGEPGWPKIGEGLQTSAVLSRGARAAPQSSGGGTSASAGHIAAVLSTLNGRPPR